MDAVIVKVTLATFALLTASREINSSTNRTRATVDFLLKFIIHNHWNNVLILTDYDSRSLMLSMSSLLVKSKVIKLKSNASIPTLISASTVFHGHQYIIVWRNSEYSMNFTITDHLQEMFGRRFTWLFVQDSKKRTVELNHLEAALGPASHVYRLSAFLKNPQQAECQLTELRHIRFNSSNKIEVLPLNDFNTRVTNWGRSNFFPLQGYSLKIVTFHVPPYVVIDRSSMLPIFRGFTMEILKHLSEYLGFSYELFIDKSGAFGGRKNGTWSGVVGTVFRKEANMAVVGHALTHERSEAVNFASYLHTTDVAAIMRRPLDTSHEWSVLLYVETFSLFLWLVCGVMCLLVFVCMVFTMTGFSFCNHHQSQATERYSVMSVIWLFVCSVLRQDTSKLPKRLSNQTIFLVFAVFVILITKNYESRLTASLTVKKEPSQYNDLDEVLANGFGIAVLGQSSSYEDLKNAKSGILKRVWNKMQSDPGSVVTSNDMGFQKVLSQDYVYLRPEVFAIPQIQKSNCAVMVLRRRYLKMTMHLLLPKNSPLTDLVSRKILQMRSSGVLRKLQEDHIPTYDPHACKSPPFLSVPVQQAIGAFAVLCLGVCGAFLSLAFEFIHERSRGLHL